MHAVPYEAVHLAALAPQPAQRWVMSYITNPAGLVGPHSRTLLHDELPIVCCGAGELWRGRGYAWSFLSERIDARLFPQVQTWAKRFIAELPFRRIEAWCDPDWAPGHRWLKSLGFKLSDPRAEAFEIDGRAAALYALVKGN